MLKTSTQGRAKASHYIDTALHGGRTSAGCSYASRVLLQVDIAHYRIRTPPETSAKTLRFAARPFRHRDAALSCTFRRKSVLARGAGKDAVQGWIDVAKLVSGGGEVKSAYKELAYQIGKDIYIDVNGWHLFLKDVTAAPDVKLNQALAQQIGEDSTQGKLNLEDLLKKIPIKIGGGKTRVSLFDAIPSFGYDDLQNIVSDFERN